MPGSTRPFTRPCTPACGSDGTTPRGVAPPRIRAGCRTMPPSSDGGLLRFHPTAEDLDLVAGAGLDRRRYALDHGALRLDVDTKPDQRLARRRTGHNDALTGGAYRRRTQEQG